MKELLKQISHKLDILLERTERKKKVKTLKERDNRSLEIQIEPFKGQYAPGMITDFILYWSESDNKGIEKWRKEKTWEIGKRLKRWQRQNEKWDHEKSQRQQLKKVDEMPVHREQFTERIDTGFSSIGNHFKTKKE